MFDVFMKTIVAAVLVMFLVWVIVFFVKDISEEIKRRRSFNRQDHLDDSLTTQYRQSYGLDIDWEKLNCVTEREYKRRCRIVNRERRKYIRERKRNMKRGKSAV